MSQDDFEGTFTSWSAGVCCVTGTDYKISFTVKTKKADRMIISSICYGGYHFNKLRVNKTTENKTTKYTIKFTYKQDNTDDQDPQYKEDNGTSPSPVFEKCNKQTLNYTFRGKNFDVELPTLLQLEALPRP